MRLKKITCGAAVLGMSAGLVLVAGASAASATIIRPYILGFDPVNVSVIGQTDPGVWDNKTCFIAPDNAHPGNNGKINNVVVGGHAGQLNITQNDGSNPVSSCATVDIGLTASSTVTNGTHPGGTFAITTQADVQGGISAASVTTVDITLSAGQVLKQPSGSTLVSGGLTGPTTSRLKLKTTIVKTKPVAAVPASCSDAIYVIDTTTNVGAKLTPKATKWDGSTIPPASSYFATIRSCAGDPGNVTGKPVTTKLSIAGSGAVSGSLYEAQTVNPATWDQTQGSCGVVKVTAVGDTFGTDAADASRILQCKGDYGVAIPFALDVRAFGTNGGQDPNGLLHAATISLGGGTFA